jgi:hypothetical protein
MEKSPAQILQRCNAKINRSVSLFKFFSYLLAGLLALIKSGW